MKRSEEIAAAIHALPPPWTGAISASELDIESEARDLAYFLSRDARYDPIFEAKRRITYAICVARSKQVVSRLHAQEFLDPMELVSNVVAGPNLIKLIDALNDPTADVVARYLYTALFNAGRRLQEDAAKYQQKTEDALGAIRKESESMFSWTSSPEELEGVVRCLLREHLGRDNADVALRFIKDQPGWREYLRDEGWDDKPPRGSKADSLAASAERTGGDPPDPATALERQRNWRSYRRRRHKFWTRITQFCASLLA